jgi:hypothetical protein
MNTFSLLANPKITQSQPVEKRQKEALNINTSGDRLGELSRVNTSLARLVALNPNTPSNLLESLSYNWDAIVRKNVTLNPNTPLKILFQLGEEFPEELCENPIVILLLIENPYCLNDLPQMTLCHILNHEKTPYFFRETIVLKGTTSLQYEVAKNRHTPAKLLDKLAQGNAAIRYAVARNPNTSIPTLQLLLKNHNQTVSLAAKTNLIRRQSTHYR